MKIEVQLLLCATAYQLAYGAPTFLDDASSNVSSTLERSTGAVKYNVDFFVGTGCHPTLETVGGSTTTDYLEINVGADDLSGNSWVNIVMDEPCRVDLYEDDECGTMIDEITSSSEKNKCVDTYGLYYYYKATC